METGAEISSCGSYRYKLWRVWDSTLPMIAFVMLNPSTANAVDNDPTIDRCIVRAKNEGCGGLYVVNLYSWRATDPRELATVSYPIGTGTTQAIIEATRAAKIVVCAWGSDKMATPNRVGTVLGIIRCAGGTPMALKVNKDGNPAHPLYLPYSLRPVPL